MHENLLNKKDTNIKTAEKYVSRYLQDLQRHFALSDMQLQKNLKKPSGLSKKT